MPGCRAARPSAWCSKNRAHVVLNISGSPFHAGKLAIRRDVLGGFACRTGTYLAYTNLVGGQDELVFDGGSLVLRPDGQLIALARRFEPDSLVVRHRSLRGADAAQRRQANGRWEKRIILRSANSTWRRAASRPGSRRSWAGSRRFTRRWSWACATTCARTASRRWRSA